MKIVRTILWVLVAFGFLIFAIYNWTPVEVKLWQNLVLETKLPVFALLTFGLGFVPLWAYHQSVKWGLNRRVRALENSLRNAALARQHDAPPTLAPGESPVDKPGIKPAETAASSVPAAPADDGGAGE